MNDDLEVVPVHVQEFYRNLFRPILVAIRWECTHVMENLIGKLDESQRNFTVPAFRQVGYDQRVKRITVTIHPLDGPEDGNAGLQSSRNRILNELFG